MTYALKSSAVAANFNPYTSPKGREASMAMCDELAEVQAELDRTKETIKTALAWIATSSAGVLSPGDAEKLINRLDGEKGEL